MQNKEIIIPNSPKVVQFSTNTPFPGDFQVAFPETGKGSGFLTIGQENRKSRDTARRCAKASINMTASQADTMRCQRVLKPSVSLGPP